MINYILPEPEFLELCNNEGQKVGKRLQKIIKHLQENFCDNKETKEEILKQYNKMNVKYNLADMVQVYFKALQDARTILVSPQETVTERVLILQAIYKFNKHMDFNEDVDE